MISINLTEKTLHFKRPARTSRGEYTEHRLVLVTMTDENGNVGIGECAPLPDLSCDAHAYDDLGQVAALIDKAVGSDDYVEVLRPYPALLFALESAMYAIHQSPILYDTPFARGEVGIPTNGLVWMASYDDMLRQVREKLAAGFRCIKLKIGAIDWEEEIRLISLIRKEFSRDQLELRVDANGAFTPDNAMQKLRQLAEYDIHSIEQPIRQGQWEAMALLCKNSPVPIALDEELIGVNSLEEKCRLLDAIRPQYVVIKPTLHGGMTGTLEWASEAQKRGIGSWMTSALESNVGLRNVALLSARIYGTENTFPQGLGTGLLFTDNIDADIELLGNRVWAGSPLVSVHTSGSTGKPKEMMVERRRMFASARMTCDFLGLRPGDTALLCMSTDYIAGKMMVVRSQERDMRLIRVAPSNHPLATIGDTHIDFAAMVPSQIYETLKVAEERQRLSHIRHVIIGGGAIPHEMESELRTFPNAIWSTYGMTETLSHIAMRRLSGSSASEWYTPMDGITVSLTDDGTDRLIIDAPLICHERIVTNDIAEIRDGQFRIIGRTDNVICSGGIKLHIEEMEEALRPHLHTDFCVTKRPDDKFGEAAVLLIQPDGTSDATTFITQVNDICRRVLPQYSVPRRIVAVSHIPYTPNGKIDRKKAEEVGSNCLTSADKLSHEHS